MQSMIHTLQTHTTWNRGLCCKDCSSRIEILITAMHEYISCSRVETASLTTSLTHLPFIYFFSLRFLCAQSQNTVQDSM